MPNILLDTSIYRRDERRRSAGFKSLTSLCQQGLVRLYVPSIVRREFSTALAANAEISVNEALTKIRRLARQEGPEGGKKLIEETLQQFQALPEKYSKYAVESFDRWLEQVKAEVRDVRPECLPDVLESYFNGQAPFKKAKSREDFPDAFIWQTVRDVASEVDRLNVIAGDKNLREAVTSIPNVEVFESLDALIQSPDIQRLFPDNFIRERADEIIQALRWSDGILYDALYDYVHTEIEGSKILHTIRDSQDDADIDSIDDISDVIFNFNRAEYYGGDIFRVPFEAELKAELDYFMLKSTFYSMSDTEIDEFDIQDSDWNESYLWVREGRYILAKGIITVTVDITQLIRDNTGNEYLDEETVIRNSEAMVEQLDSLTILDRRFSI